MRLTLEQLQSVVATWVQSNKMGATFTATTDNIAGLLDKIGKMITIDGDYSDKLIEMDGDDLPLGKTIEEWFEDLILPTDYDLTGANALAPNDPTYRAPSYSYPFKKQKFKTTRRYNDLQIACNTEDDFNKLINKITQRLYDSLSQFKFYAKKEILGDVAKKAYDAMNSNTAYATGLSIGTFCKDSATTARGVCMVQTTQATYAAAVTKGEVVPLDLVCNIAKPTDTTSGEAFIEQIKSDVEKSQFVNEGHSFNGNTIGASVNAGLVLYVLTGVKPKIETYVNAGAFQLGEVAIPATMRVVDSFGSKAPEGVFAILADSRGIKLHKGYQAIRTGENADGDFINYVLHYQATGFESRNTFVKVYIDNGN